MVRLIAVALAATALAVGLAPSASADPAGRLAGLTEVGDDPGYHTYNQYGYISSAQFATADGAHCRLYGMHRGSWPPHADCWGELPGTAANYASTGEGSSEQTSHAVLLSTDIAKFEESRQIGPEGHGWKDITYDDSDYKILQPGSKITLDGSSCGAVAHDIICITGHPSRGIPATVGFILSPGGSYTF